MVLLINVLQAIKRNVRVHLRSRNISVALGGVDGSEICAVLQHVRRATMALHMMAGVATCAQRSVADKLPNTLPRQLAGASSQKKERRGVSSRKHGARFPHVLSEGLLSGLAQWHDSLFVNFSAYQHMYDIEL